MLAKLINLAIVDDRTLFRKVLKDYISGQNNINVVIQSPDIYDLTSKLKDFNIHILVMNLATPKLGIPAVQKIRNEHPGIKILVLTTSSDTEVLSELLDLGVYGILSQSDDPEELIRAIQTIAEQKIYRSKLFTEAMYWNKQYKNDPGNRQNDIFLNEREKQLIQLLWEEKSNKEIADTLFLSIRSVEKIRQDLKEKIAVKSTIGLLKYAISRGIISMSFQTASNFSNTRN